MNKSYLKIYFILFDKLHKISPINLVLVYLNDILYRWWKTTCKNDKFNKKKNTARFLVALTKKQNVSQIINKY